MRIIALVSVLLATVALVGCGTPATSKPVAASWPEVQAILQRRCLICHTGEHPVVMPDFTSRAVVRQFIEPGDADASHLFNVLQLSRKAPAAMPPTKHFLPRSEREAIRAWINEGAPWPEGDAGTLKPDPAQPRQISS